MLLSWHFPSSLQVMQSLHEVTVRCLRFSSYVQGLQWLFCSSNWTSTNSMGRPRHWRPQQCQHSRAEAQAGQHALLVGRQAHLEHLQQAVRGGAEEVVLPRHVAGPHAQCVDIGPCTARLLAAGPRSDQGGRLKSSLAARQACTRMHMGGSTAGRQVQRPPAAAGPVQQRGCCVASHALTKTLAP